MNPLGILYCRQPNAPTNVATSVTGIVRNGTLAAVTVSLSWTAPTTSSISSYRVACNGGVTFNQTTPSTSTTYTSQEFQVTSGVSQLQVNCTVTGTNNGGLTATSATISKNFYL